MECARSGDFTLVEGILDNLLAAEQDELDASDVEEAIAAAELAAHAAGHGDGELPTILRDWVERLSVPPTRELLTKARAAIRKVLNEPSELQDLWAESDDCQDWLASLGGLLERLKG